jgi:hypothetical protein
LVSLRIPVWIGLLLVLGAGCAAAGKSDRPPNVAPAPSQAAISNVGFDQAVKLGSDYVYVNTGVSNPTVAASRTLPGGMLELTFDLGPGVPDPARVVIDPNGKGELRRFGPAGAGSSTPRPSMSGPEPVAPRRRSGT